MGTKSFPNWLLGHILVAMETKCLENVAAMGTKALLVSRETEIYVDRLPCKQNTMKTGCHKDRKL